VPEANTPDVIVATPAVSVANPPALPVIVPPDIVPVTVKLEKPDPVANPLTVTVVSEPAFV
jgi:hypothetical protein